MSVLNVMLDTEKETVCDRCDRDLGPSEVKYVAGLMVDDENYVLVYCWPCWERMQKLGQV